jgi:hypothetical protein
MPHPLRFIWKILIKFVYIKRFTMKKIGLLLASAILTMTWMRGQDCSSMYLPQRADAQLEYEQYSADDRLTGSTIQRITNLQQSANSVQATIAIESYDAEGQAIGDMEVDVRCEDGIYYIDMANYFNQQAMQGMEDMEISIEGGNLELPSELHEGDELEGGEMTISVSAGGMTIMNMTISIGDRKVEAVENVTTDAGTFECYKVSYVISMQMMGNMQTKGIEWFAKNVGMVRSETYGDDGKLAAYTVLTSLK